MQIGHTSAGMIRAYICMSAVFCFFLHCCTESRPIELYTLPERGRVYESNGWRWKLWVITKLGMRSFKKKKEERLRGADWVLRRSKNKQVAFLIKAALKERVGGVGGRLRSKQAESFLYTHFLWSGHFGSEQQGEITCLVYAILHHSMRSHTQSYYTCTPMRTHSSTRAHTCAVCMYAHPLTHIQELHIRTVGHTTDLFQYLYKERKKCFLSIRKNIF